MTIGAGSAQKPVMMWLVRYDARTLAAPIRAGENGGRTLAHRNVVRSLDALGAWRGARIAFAIPAAANQAYRGAILVQQGRGGPIIAATKL